MKCPYRFQNHLGRKTISLYYFFLVQHAYVSAYLLEVDLQIQTPNVFLEVQLFGAHHKFALTFAPNRVFRGLYYTPLQLIFLVVTIC